MPRQGATTPHHQDDSIAQTGIPGLNDILNGGYARGRLYLVEGVPGSGVDASYLADSVILLRYFEAGGEVRQAISVVKKRRGVHERTIREYSMSSGRIKVGDALRKFRGILTGVPVYEGSNDPLLGTDRPR